MLAHEIVRGHNNLSPICALTINLQETFNLCSWDFVFFVLEVTSFPTHIVGWISYCVTALRFSISVNGGLVRVFRGARGIRMGDPLSPYIFFISMNVLSRLLNVSMGHEYF